MMKSLPPAYHLAAIGVALFLIVGLRIQDLDLRPLVGPIDDRWIRIYTPYFPGLGKLDQHEIFSPVYADKKKIVLLGPSAVDSIGCDSSWSLPDITRQPVRNAHHSCAIAAQLNEQLQAAGLRDWRAFNLARNGSQLTSALYVYARILALKPEIVILGDPFPYFAVNNAGAESLSARQYAYLDEIFGATPETRATWTAYRENLARRGGVPVADASPSQSDAAAPPHRRTTVKNVLIHALTIAGERVKTEGPPLPVKFSPYRSWDVQPYVPHAFENPDPGFAYFQGVTLIARLQKRAGNTFYFYFSPQFDHRHDLAYIEGLTDVFGGYLAGHGILFSSYVAMDLKPISETYDGTHQTLYGNRVIARAILNDLRTQRLVE